MTAFCGNVFLIISQGILLYPFKPEADAGGVSDKLLRPF
jgi:hypothetical protein